MGNLGPSGGDMSVVVEASLGSTYASAASCLHDSAKEEEKKKKKKKIINARYSVGLSRVVLVIQSAPWQVDF